MKESTRLVKNGLNMTALSADVFEMNYIVSEVRKVATGKIQINVSDSAIKSDLFQV